MFDAAWDLWDSPLPYKGADVLVPKEELCQAPGNNTENSSTLRSEMTLNCSMVLAFSSLGAQQLPLLDHLPPPPNDLDDLPETPQQPGASLVDDVWHSTRSTRY